MSLKPRYRPQKSKQDVAAICETNGVDWKSGAVVGVRGYFQDSMGKAGENDRGLYDDAIFIISENEFRAFNGNTDPSRYRKGYGKSEATKGMAELDCGVWEYRLGKHKQQYMALIQAAEVTVTRDGRPDYKDTGWFGINIHRGGEYGTSSLGCQTIHPVQWDEFIDLASFVIKKSNKTIIPYCLIEQQG